MNRSAVVFFALFGLALGGAIIGNGKVILGVDNLGQLNIPYKAVTFADGGVPLPNTDPAGVRVVGLRLDEYPFPPSTEPGCVCEGWGAKYVINGVSTYKAGVDNAAGVFGASLVSFTGTDGANIATSVVSLTGGAKVTHVFRTSPNPNIYRVVITVENPSTVPYTSFIYRRQMDWDIYPTQFNEFVTIRGAAGHPKLDSSCDDGFVGGDVDTRRCISVPGGFKQNFEWSGPADHGAYFDFQVGPIAAGKSVTFTMYYGVGKTYTETDTAINSLPLEVLSYGASNLGGRPNLNSYVFAWGFSGTGGETITKPPFTVVAPDDYTVECGSAVVRADPTFFGNCDDQPLTSLTSSETITAGSCASNYVITRTFTGTDRCGKTSTVSQKITVRDTTAPVITAPSTAVYECGSTASVSATASDTCGAATLTFVDTATTPASCVGTGFNRVFTARDACGNTATATTVVTSRDTTAPTLTIPANIEVDCSGSTATASTGTATATDSCSTPTVTYSDVVSGSGCPRTISRTWTAVDKCGNRVTGTQTITVRPFCGDGVAQGAEQCDLGASNGAYGSCCTSTCTFAATSTACRVSAGLCDIVEYCSGTSSACPADTVKPNGTPCGEFFGMCDVSLEKSCTGTSPSCAGPPAFPGFPEVNASWTDYNVISFNQFQVSGGDVEGRLAVRNKATLSGFTLGLELRLETDSWRKHSLFVAGDASWTDGSLHPDGTNVGASGPAASAYVGGVASFPAYLASRLDTTVPFTAAAASSGFDTLKAYYQGIQSQLSSIPTNVAATVQYTNGLLLTCSETSDFYHVTIPAAVFSSTHWTELRNCKFTAAWVVDITGNDDVVIQGQPFPAIVERVIYNVLGTNTVRGATGVAGNILAPNSNYDMPSGVTYGVLVAGNVTFARQNNKPNCLVYNPVTLATKTSKPIRVGDSTIWMVSLPSFIAGDRVCVNGDCKKVIGGESRDIDGDGVVDHGIVVDTVFAVSHPADSFATAVVENPSAADRSAPLPEVSGGEDNKQGSSSAVTLTISMALIAILALFF